MPKFRFRAPNGVIRSRSTKTRDPGYTHAVMEDTPWGGWQISAPWTSAKAAEEWISDALKRWPDRKYVVVPRLAEPKQNVTQPTAKIVLQALAKGFGQTAERLTNASIGEFAAKNFAQMIADGCASAAAEIEQESDSGRHD